MKLAPASFPMLALAMAASACAYPHPSDAAPQSVQQTWKASEKGLRSMADSMPHLGVPALGSGFDRTLLAKFGPSMRHGADDQRRLSRYDSASHTVVSDGPIARIVAVKGIEYKPLAEFGSTPYPIAIIYVDSGPGAPGYTKLGLQPGTNYWIVKYDAGNNTWTGWIQPPTGNPVQLATEAKGVDTVEPVSAARFVWDTKDEQIWGLCGGRCCWAKGPALQ